MKKLISLAVVLLALASAMAQSDHLTFKGVPIDGALADFSQKLAEKGFKQVAREGNGMLMKGTFAGKENCMALASRLDNKDLTYSVAVIFPDMDQWRQLEGLYLELKEMLTQKYGKPASVVEEFQGYSQPRTDNSKLTMLQLDQCNFVTVFETDKGTIKLMLAHQSIASCYVLLGYFDGINSALSASAAYDDL